MDVLMLAGSLVYLVVLAPAFSAIALAAMAVFAIVLVTAARGLKADQRIVMRDYAALESTYIDSLTGISEIIGFDVSGGFVRMLTTMYRQYQGRTKRLGFTQARIVFWAEGIGGVLLTAVFAYGAVLVIRGGMLVGQMVGAYSVLAGIVPSVVRLVDANVALQGASLAGARLLDLSLSEEERSEGRADVRLVGAVHVDRVSFAWPRGSILFKDLSLSIRVGCITGLWGPSGSGKSTLADILHRKYRPDSGSVRFDDTDISQFHLSGLRAAVGVVPESVKIFNGALRSNILLGRREGHVPIEARIVELGLAPFFSRFARGLETIVGETGQQLSTGERQVVAFVRAMIARPRLLIIDEGVNTVDALTSECIYQALIAHSATSAVLVITHDDRLLARCATVFVLERGSVTASGAPREHIGRGGELGQLWQRRLTEAQAVLGDERSRGTGEPT